MLDNWNSQHSFNCQFVEHITDNRQETVTTKSNHEKASACHSHLFCFRLLVITIKKHGGINGHIRSYNCWRGRPETLCRRTATGTCLCVMVSPSTWFSDQPWHQKLFQIKLTFNLCFPGRKARRHLGPLPVFWRARQHKPEDWSCHWSLQVRKIFNSVPSHILINSFLQRVRVRGV